MRPVSVPIQGESIAGNCAPHSGEPAGAVVGIGGFDPVKVGKGFEPSRRPAVAVGGLLSVPGNGGQAVCVIVSIGDRGLVRVGYPGEISGGVIRLGEAETLGIRVFGDSSGPVVGIGGGPEGIAHAGKSVEVIVAVDHLAAVRVSGDSGHPCRSGGIGEGGSVPVRFAA